MSNQTRVQAGIPDGGQYSESAKARPDVSGLGGFYDSLDNPHEPSAPTFTADAGASEGTRSPWGEVQHVEQIATGITSVSTDSHGGMKLSPERNRQIPKPLRTRDRWYEEDCQWAAIAKTFPDDFDDRQVEQADESLRYWSPNEYESAYGETVPDHQRSPEFRSDDDPDKIRLYGTKGEREARADEHQAEREDESAAHQARPKYAGFSPKLTDGQAQKLLRTGVDINGEVKPLYVVFNEGVPGKVAYFDDHTGKVEHFIEHPTEPDRVIPISKQVWDKFDAPDGRTPRRRIQSDIDVAQHEVDRLERQAQSLSSVSWGSRQWPEDELRDATARVNDLCKKRDALPEDS